MGAGKAGCAQGAEPESEPDRSGRRGCAARPGLGVAGGDLWHGGDSWPGGPAGVSVDVGGSVAGPVGVGDGVAVLAVAVGPTTHPDG